MDRKLLLTLLLPRLALTGEQRILFEQFSLYCDKYSEYIPVSWVLGFYVNLVVSRFASTYKMLAWPDSDAVFQCFMNEIPYRRTVARLINLSNVLGMRDVSSAVKKRFPTMDHVMNAGFMTQEEYVKFELLKLDAPKYWMPVQWAMDLVSKAHEEGKIRSERYVIKLHEQMMSFRASIGSVLSLDWISVPLVYTQVVTIAVKIYFLACLFGRQFLDTESPLIDRYKVTVPAYYIDLLAESLINPLGEDDDDFEMNYLVDRNLQISYLIVDKNNYNTPTVDRDIYWDQEVPEIAHTEASAGLKEKPEEGSAVPVTVTGPEAEQFLTSKRTSTRTSIAGSIQSGLNKLGFSSGFKESIRRKLSGTRPRKRSSQLKQKRSLPSKNLLEPIVVASASDRHTEEEAVLDEFHLDHAPLGVITEVSAEIEKRGSDAKGIQL